jgi:formiminoglutamate deiminase
MYAVADRLTPESYYELAKATYREMALAGITSVGEFHYLHHGRGGTPYDEANTMGLAVVEAARDAGLRMTLLDTCYLAAGIGSEPQGVQSRFSDGDAARWQDRVESLHAALDGRDGVVVGAAVHSVRAVPRDQLTPVVGWAEKHQAPLHFHVSEQVAENDACLAAYGRTPTEVLAEAGALGPGSTAVHATHLTGQDIEILGSSGTTVCLCPTTERDLGDGIGPSRRLVDAGCRMTLGSDSHAVIDPFEEMRAVELDERLASGTRGHFPVDELVTAATRNGHLSLGHDAGRIAAGCLADLVTLDVHSPRSAGTGADASTAVFAATAADVTQVVAGGRVVATASDRVDVGRELGRAIHAVSAAR